MGKKKAEKPAEVPAEVAPAIGAEGRTVTKYLPVSMDAGLVLATGRDLVAKLEQIEELDATLAKVKADHKTTRDKLQEEALALRKAMKSGTSEVAVECREIPDWDRGVVVLVRTDREEGDHDRVVDTRTMTEGERQVGFTFPEARAKGALAEIATRAGDAPSNGSGEAASSPASSGFDFDENEPRPGPVVGTIETAG